MQGVGRLLRQFPLINLPSPLVSTPLYQLGDRELSVRVASARVVETRQPGYILCEKSPNYFFNPLLYDAADAAFVVGPHASDDRLR